MRIKSLNIRGFRCFRDLSLTFDPQLTTLVGENGTGKSTIGLAVSKLITQCISGGDEISDEDYPYGIPGHLAIEATLDLSPNEVETILIAPLLGTRIADDDEISSKLRQWLLDQGPEIVLSLTRPGAGSPLLRWGEVQFRDKVMAVGVELTGAVNIGWRDVLSGAYGPAVDTIALINEKNVGGIALSSDQVGRALHSKYRMVQEFRARSEPGQRTGAVESMSGLDTASALLNLKNHSSPSQRARYDDIVKAFGALFPRYLIAAVEQSPGAGTPDIQFIEAGEANPVSISGISAGMHQALTLLVDLVAREGMIVFLEHPEQHLHPHSMRFLQSFLRKGAEVNQIIVATHEPYFVDPSAALGVRRFWWTKDAAARAFEIPTSMTNVQMAQIETALRHLRNREIVFARSVILVEDESQQGFLTTVAPTLDHDIDAHSVSIISVDGHDGYKPYEVLLKALRIPYVCLRDRPWGAKKNHPRDRFFSLGAELEDYLDNNGLAEARQKVIHEVGTSKRRVASALGASVTKGHIPPVFSDVLKAAVDLATGEPTLAT